jgi:hypothetical protein
MAKSKLSLNDSEFKATKTKKDRKRSLYSNSIGNIQKLPQQ